MEPVTATLPVAPGSVHSGVPPPAGAAVGQVLSAVAGCRGSAEAGVNPSMLGDGEDELVEGSFFSEPHAAIIVAADAAQTTSATDEYTRGMFTVVTLHSGNSA